MYSFKINKKSFHDITTRKTKKVVVGLMDDKKTAITSYLAWAFKHYPVLDQIKPPIGGFIKGNFIWTAISDNPEEGIVTGLVVANANEPIRDRRTTLSSQMNIVCDHIKQMKHAGFKTFEIQTWRLLTDDAKSNASPINIIEYLLPFAQANDIEISLNVPTAYVTADIERTYGDHIEVVVPEDIAIAKPAIPTHAEMPTALRKAYQAATENTGEKKRKVIKTRQPRNEVVVGSYASLGDLLKKCHE